MKESYRLADSQLPSPVEREIREHLAPGESLIWAGTPKQGLTLRPSDLFMIPFSLLWGGFAVFWFASALRMGAPLPFAMFGVPFILVGLYMVVGRFWVDARIRKNTVYGLTSQRVIMVSGLFAKAIKSLPLRGLQDITLTIRGDATGTVSFGREHAFGGFYSGLRWPGTERYKAPAFELIEGAKLVHEQVLAAKRTLEEGG